MKKLKLATLLTLTMVIGLPITSFAAQEGSQQLRVKTGMPKRKMETIFSSLIAWKQEAGARNKAKGLAFVDGSNTKKTITEIGTAKAIAKSLSAGINYEAPRARGAKVNYTKDKDELVITNTTGFDLTRIVLGDYTNQKLRYSIPNKKFSDAGVDIAIDLVYSAAVDYVDSASAKAVTKAAGGTVTVMIDNDSPIIIQTKDKSTQQLESELGKALGKAAHFSSEPIYPNIVQLQSRNYKPFDKGETQLINLSATSITIDVDDPSLSILTKFRFPVINQKEDNFENSVIKLVSFLMVACLGYIVYIRRRGLAK